MQYLSEVYLSFFTLTFLVIDILLEKSQIDQLKNH